MKIKTVGQEGKAILTFDKEKTKIYLHTPEGVEDPPELESLTLPIIKGKENIIIKTDDKDSPENFKPEISRDANIFENRWFLVFATQDKTSGVDHYEVCERKKKCVVAESPYLLQNQDLNEEIVVKAADKNGNERVTAIPAQKPRAWYKNYAISSIFVIIIIVCLMRKILWEKRRK